MERWKKIDGYDNYSVSDMGRVRNDRTGRILKPGNLKQGYTQVHLSKNGKITNHLIHRLVALTFIPNPDNLPQVNHINEDKTDNHVNNLEWCTQQYNNTYGTRIEQMLHNRNGKFAQKQCIVDDVRYVSIRDAARHHSISTTTLAVALKRGQSHCLGHTICYC